VKEVLFTRILHERGKIHIYQYIDFLRCHEKFSAVVFVLFYFSKQLWTLNSCDLCDEQLRKRKTNNFVIYVFYYGARNLIRGEVVNILANLITNTFMG